MERERGAGHVRATDKVPPAPIHTHMKKEKGAGETCRQPDSQTDEDMIRLSL
jgi:hypothetical protein